MNFLERAALCSHPVSKALFTLMHEKRTRLAVAADVTNSSALLKLADELGPHIALFKTHIDIIDDFTPELTYELGVLAKRHRFLIFEDRKFADIGTTVVSQYAGGIYKIASWADIINAHILPGPGIIDSLSSVGLPKKRGLLLLAQLSSKEALTTPAYARQAVQWAACSSDFVIGFICQEKLTDDPRFIHMTPGIHLSSSTDAHDQQYNTPAAALARGTDLLIVGRAITSSPNPAATALEYKKEMKN